MRPLPIAAYARANTEQVDGERFDTLYDAALALELERNELLEALYNIAAVRDKLDGGDWDEITEARAIAVDAIAKANGK